jgi:hypothetical protein
MSRRHVLAATVLAACRIEPPSSPLRATVSASIRLAEPKDLPGIVALLIQDAQERCALDHLLWRVAPDAPVRVEAALGATLNRAGAPASDRWLVAEHSSRIVGVMHAMIVQAPPILAPPGDAGLVLDDSFVSSDAPPNTDEALLLASEAALKAAGVTALVASCPAAGRLRPLYERHGYVPVALYMAKHGFTAAALPHSVRAASIDDVPEIVKLSAAHRRTLEKLNPRFWRIHPEADSRFDAWMRRSLTLEDRNMLVAAAPDELHGYVIAQPCSPLLLPIAHEIAAVGLIDDFYDDDFADVSALSNGGANAEDLLGGAENTFARRAVGGALVVCPAAWSSKVSLLERSGYQTAKQWMLKR